MRVKKYRAPNMPEAINLIRADLGPDAVILHSQKVRSGRWYKLFHQPVLEVTAAVDTDLRDFPQPTSATADTVQQMQRELTALRLALSQMAQAKQATSVQREDDRIGLTGLDGWYRQLLDQGVSGQLARQIVRAAADELSQWALDNANILNPQLHWQLERRLPSTTSTLIQDRPSVYFIVGSTGVGKTTTLAKRAAQFRDRQIKPPAVFNHLEPKVPGRSSADKGGVLIITIDTFRVAALPQILTFGEILGVPVKVAYSPAQLAALVEANKHYNLILIDTPGRNHRVVTAMTELADFLVAVPAKTVHLAVAAGSRYEDMRQTVTAFQKVSLDGLIFTKVDETVSLGPAYSLACETGLPLSYFTTGQRVPEDIEIATAKRMVDLLTNPTFEQKVLLESRQGESSSTVYRLPNERKSNLYELRS